MGNDIFTEISIIVAIGSAVGLVMHLLRQPLIIGHILTGVLVGPTIFDLVHSDEIIELFSKIGIALLLFIVGLGLNVKVIKGLGKVSFIVGMSQVLITLTVGGLVARVMGYDTISSFAIGVALAFSSTIIVLKLLSDKKELGRLHGKISIGVLIVQDLLATIALFVAAALSKEGLSFYDGMALTVKGAAIVTILFLISNYILPKVNKVIADSQEFLFLFAIGWGLGIASLFEIAGYSIEVGALLAGIALAPMPYAQEIGSRMRPLRDFFIVIFFISLGLLLDVASISEVWLPATILTMAVLIINPLAILITMGLMGYSRKTSFYTALLMAQISEFSLVFIILMNQSGRIDSNVLTVITLVGILSITISTYLIIYTDKIYAMLEKHLVMFERRKVHYDQSQADKYDAVIFGYKKGGNEFARVMKSMKAKFVVVDYDPEVIDRLELRGLHYLYGDATDSEMLDEAGVDTSKLVITTISDPEVNQFLVSHVHKVNHRAVIIATADTPEQALALYESGANYVMMPHYIGSVKIGAFIKKNGFKPGEFKKWRDQHLAELISHKEH